MDIKSPTTGQENVPVRIVHLVAALHAGGIERLLLAMAPYWDRERFSVEVWCLNIGSIQEYIDLLKLKGVPVRVLGRREREKIEPGLFWRLAAAIADDKVYIIHSHTQYPLAVALLVRLFFRLNVVHIHHQHSLPSKLQIQIMRYLGWVKLPHHVIAVSAWMEETIRSLVPGLRSTVSVIHNGIEIPNLEPGIDKNRLFHVYTAARLTPPKNVELLVIAMQSVLAKCPDATLTILGDGELLEDIRETSRKLGIEKNVIFLGYVLQPEKLYADLDVFVLPSLSEAFGLSLIEAMALGKPCVATDVGGTQDFLIDNKNGLSVPSNDPTSMAEAILRILTDRSLAKRLGNEARQTAQEFSIMKTVKNIETLYNNYVNHNI